MVGIIGQLPITVTGSAVLGTGQSAASSILGASEDGSSALFGSLGSTQNSLYTQIKNNASQRLADALAVVDKQAAERNAAINVQNERWISVKAQINNAQAAVSNGQDSVQNVANTLLLMRGSIAGAGTPGENVQLYKDQFDAQVNVINNEAESSGTAFNLVGNINRDDGTPNTVTYRSDVNLNSSTLTGTYVGSDFTIKAADGTTWKPELGSDLIEAYAPNSSTPKTYITGAGQKLPMATSTRNGLKLLSYDPNTKQISVQISVVPDDPPIIVTGKLQQSGIGVMQSWFYNGFATTADRQRAFTDINRAEVNLASASADLERSATQTSMDQRHADAALNDLSSQTTKANADMQTQENNLKITAVQQYQAMQANLQNLSNQQSNYLQAFASFVGDAFTQSLLDINS